MTPAATWTPDRLALNAEPVIARTAPQKLTATYLIVADDCQRASAKIVKT